METKEQTLKDKIYGLNTNLSERQVYLISQLIESELSSSQKEVERLKEEVKAMQQRN